MSWPEKGMRLLVRRTEALGLAPSLLLMVAWVGCGAAGARASALALWQYPELAQVFVGVIATLVAIGGLVGFWIIAPLVDFRNRGYRVRWLIGNEWVYEERRTDGSMQCLPFS